MAPRTACSRGEHTTRVGWHGVGCSRLTEGKQVPEHMPSTLPEPGGWYVSLNSFSLAEILLLAGLPFYRCQPVLGSLLDRGTRFWDTFHA